MRLVNGTTDNEGIVHICIDGQWNTACSRGWDIAETLVTCRELGFMRELMYEWTVWELIHGQLLFLPRRWLPSRCL